jgi:hypothetical protein
LSVANHFYYNGAVRVKSFDTVHTILGNRPSYGVYQYDLEMEVTQKIPIDRQLIFALPLCIFGLLYMERRGYSMPWLLV